MTIIDARWTKRMNQLRLRCDCGQEWWHWANQRKGPRPWTVRHAALRRYGVTNRICIRLYTDTPANRVRADLRPIDSEADAARADT